MKNHSEQILILGGSIFLVGLIIADVLIQRSAPKDNPSIQIAQANAKAASPGQPVDVDTEDVDQAVPETDISDVTDEMLTKVEEKTSIAVPLTLPNQAESNPPGVMAAWGVESALPHPVQKASQEMPKESLHDASGERVAWYQSNTSNISPVQFNVFFNALRPYGRWFKHNNHGACWIPQVGQGDAQWRPYLNGGRWAYQDGSWLWVSDYRWGSYPFHYGRWFHTSKGWAWKPEGHWSAAWVSWRNSDAYCGWSPLPPTDQEVAAAVASTLNHRINTKDLTADHYVFLRKEHLLDPVPTRELLDAQKAKQAFEESTQSDHFYADKGSRWFNKGIPVQDVMSKIKMAESAQKTGAGHQTLSHSNQQGPGGMTRGLTGIRQVSVDTGFTRQQGQTGRAGTIAIPSPSLGASPSQQGLAPRQVHATTRSAQVQNLMRAEQAPSVANYNRVQPLSVRQNVSR